MSFLNGVNGVNGSQSDLKFSLDPDLQRVSFLDMQIEFSNGSLITTLYKKDTDRNTFLLASLIISLYLSLDLTY